MTRAKVIVGGGLAFFAASLLVSLVLAVPDEAFFDDAYQTTTLFWREGVIEQGWDEMAPALAWLAHKLAFGFGVAVLYNWVLPSLSGPGWKQGILFGLGTWPLVVATYVGLWSMFELQGTIWIWWGVHYLITAVVSGAAMGAIVEGISESKVRSPSIPLLHPIQTSLDIKGGTRPEHSSRIRDHAQRA